MAFWELCGRLKETKGVWRRLKEVLEFVGLESSEMHLIDLVESDHHRIVLNVSKNFRTSIQSIESSNLEPTLINTSATKT